MPVLPRSLSQGVDLAALPEELLSLGDRRGGGHWVFGAAPGGVRFERHGSGGLGVPWLGRRAGWVGLKQVWLTPRWIGGGRRFCSKNGHGAGRLIGGMPSSYQK